MPDYGVTDEHFERAALTSCSALQNPVQQPPARARNGSYGVLVDGPVKNTTPQFSGENEGLRDLATGEENLFTGQVGDTGFEPVTSTV